MKKRLLFAVALLIIININCLIITGNDYNNENKIYGSGKLMTEKLFVSEFHSVVMNTSGTVNISKGHKQSAVIKVDDNIMNYIKITVYNGRLEISTKQNVILSNYDLTIDLTMTNLEELKTQSAGSIYGLTKFEVDRARFVISSAGNISINIDADYIDSRLSSAGSLTLKGTAKEHHALVSSAGNLRAFDLATKETSITLSSAGHAEVNVSDLLDARITSAGSLFYTGNPVVYQYRSSLGRIYNYN